MSEEPTRTSVALARLPVRGSPISKVRVFHAVFSAVLLFVFNFIIHDFGVKTSHGFYDCPKATKRIQDSRTTFARCTYGNNIIRRGLTLIFDGRLRLSKLNILNTVSGNGTRCLAR